jgi:vacuolar-type H+-ATPase subunit I/STV1
MWRLAKSMNFKQLIRDDITRKKSLRNTKKEAFAARLESIRKQVAAKKEILRQHKRRVASDPGQEPMRNQQLTEFKLYNKLIRETEREIRALEKELEATKKEKDAEMSCLEEEIKVLEANLRLYG